MKWILFVMLFTTAAYTHKGKPDPVKAKEESHQWTLQSSNSMEFATHEGCIAAGKRLYAAIAPVATATFRGYCLCESTDKNKKCPEEKGKTQPPFTLLPEGAGTTTGIELIKP